MESFYGAVTDADWSSDTATSALWNACESARKSFKARVVRQSWDYANTYLGGSATFAKTIDPLMHFFNCEKILLFDGLCDAGTGAPSITHANITARSKECLFRALSQTSWRGLSIQAGGELADNVNVALASMLHSQVVYDACKPYVKAVYNPPILAMPGGNQTNVIKAVYATKRPGIPTVDYYVDVSGGGSVGTLLTALIAEVEAAFLTCSIPHTALAVMEYGMSANYAGATDQATSFLTMQSQIEARGYKTALAYSLTDASGLANSSRAFGFVKPDTAATRSWATTVFAAQ